MDPPDAADLFDRHHLQLYRYLRRVTGDPGEAEDLTQEVFLRVSRSAGSGPSDQRAGAWLFRIARNLVIDRWRRRRLRQDREAPESPTESPRGELRVELHEALERVPGEDREMFLLRELGGLSYTEIGAVTGCTEAAVRSRIYRARKRLRQLLEPLSCIPEGRKEP